MKIFVTGGTGFIGKFVLDYLSGEHEVLALARPGREMEVSGVQFLSGDLGNLAAIKSSIKEFNPEAVIHLAWQGIPDFSAALCQLNLSQSIALVDFLVSETSVRKIVMSGSCYEYGRTEGICEESQATVPVSFFTWAKSSLYQYASLLCKDKKVECVWMRPFYVYGPGQRKKSLIPTLIDSFANQTVPGINNPFNANDFIYVGDVAEGFCRAAIQDVPSGIYNLGSGHSTSVLDICRIVEKQIRDSADFTEQLKARSSALQSVNFWAFMQKTKMTFGWVPSVSMEEGILKSIEALEQA